MRKTFQRFFASESFGAWLLIFTIVFSLIIANSPVATAFSQLLSAVVGFNGGGVHLQYSVLSWINDGLMALFFLLVGLEVKRSFVEGELSSFQKASLPVFAAIGGCVVPALFFVFFNTGTATARGWAIPMATDIAFALAILGMAVGHRAGSLKVFLSTLAIADDICAILVIAIFYSAGLHINYLLAAALVIAIQFILNKTGVVAIWPYLITGLLLWYFVHHAGIHATIAGVLTAFAVPLTGKEDESPLEKLEHALLTPVNYFIVPLFALVNTNITFESAMFSDIVNPLSLGIFTGLLLGKPIGIMLMSFATVKLKISSLPKGMEWKHILGLGMLAGISFTMSVFVALLSYERVDLQVKAKFFILVSSALAGLCGYFFFRQIQVKNKV